VKKKRKKKKKGEKSKKIMGVVTFITAWEKQTVFTALKCPRVSARPSRADRLDARYKTQFHVRFSSYLTENTLSLLYSTYGYH
jgi:hypothetical protein